MVTQEFDSTIRSYCCYCLNPGFIAVRECYKILFEQKENCFVMQMKKMFITGYYFVEKTMIVPS